MHLVCHKDKNFEINVSIGIYEFFLLSQKNVIRLKIWKVTRMNTESRNYLSLIVPALKWRGKDYQGILTPHWLNCACLKNLINLSPYKHLSLHAN